MTRADDAPSPGLGLGPLLRALGRPWRDLDRRIPLRWLTPALPVRVTHTDGRQSTWAGDVRLDGSSLRQRVVVHHAVELPQDDRLEYRMRMPPMSRADLREAVALQVQSSSPFEAADLVWGWRADEAEGGGIDATAVLASRRTALGHVERSRASLDRPDAPEVWSFDAAGRPVVVEGFGEERRRRRIAVRRRAGYALVALALVLGTAVAVTPTVQLSIRAKQAGQAAQDVERRLAPVLAQREALVRAQADREALRELMAERIEPVLVVDLLSQIVPEDTWLQRMQVQGARVTLTGQTANTAALMNTLNSHPQVRDVKAPAPATRAVGGRRENFTIELSLVPEALRPALAARAAPAASGAASVAGPRT